MNEFTLRVRPLAPAALKNNVINRIKKERRMRTTRMVQRTVVAAAIVGAAVALPFALGGGEARAAQTLLAQAIEQTGAVNAEVVNFEVRTRPKDNFDALDSGAFVPHTFSKSFAAPQVWRLQKTGRTAVCTGDSAYMWVASVDVGSVWRANDAHNIIGVGGYFFEPQKFLQHAQLLAQSKGAKVSVTENNGATTLTIVAKAEGDFANPYAKNSSIAESDSRQILEFDSRTKLLRRLEVQVFYGGKYQTVLRTTSIDYNVPLNIAALTSRPQNVK
jgi:hypothetical protein